jgi:hypothetical protein
MIELPTIALHIAAQFCPKKADFRPTLEGIRVRPCSDPSRVELLAANGFIGASLSFRHSHDLVPIQEDIPSSPFVKLKDGGCTITQQNPHLYDVEIVHNGKQTLTVESCHKLPDHFQQVLGIGEAFDNQMVGDFSRWMLDPAPMMVPLKIAQKWGDGKVLCLRSFRNQSCLFQANLDLPLITDAVLQWVIMPISAADSAAYCDDPHANYSAARKEDA